MFDEIDDIVAEHTLPAELEIREAAVSQVSPDELFMFGLAPPQVSGTLAILVGHEDPPNPSPAAGRGEPEFKRGKRGTQVQVCRARRFHSQSAIATQLTFTASVVTLPLKVSGVAESCLSGRRNAFHHSLASSRVHWRNGLQCANSSMMA
jgi:hypothetical protein